jgi:hypothetical protein
MDAAAGQAEVQQIAKRLQVVSRQAAGRVLRSLGRCWRRPMLTERDPRTGGYGRSVRVSGTR